MLGIVGFLTGPLGKIATYAGIVLVVVGIAFGYLKLKEHEAVQQATLQYNIEQLQQVQKQNDAYKAQIDTLQQQADVLVKQNDDLNKAVDTQKDEIDSFILNSNDQTLDPLFNQVLNKMKGK
jgi:peptidoglycan hydrolase CwlO-like protein